MLRINDEMNSIRNEKWYDGYVVSCELFPELNYLLFSVFPSKLVVIEDKCLFKVTFSNFPSNPPIVSLIEGTISDDKLQPKYKNKIIDGVVFLRITMDDEYGWKYCYPILSVCYSILLFLSIQSDKYITKYPPPNTNIKLKSGLYSEIGKRPTMEDEHIDQYISELNGSLYAIFDGHGGTFVSEYLKANFINVFINQMTLNQSDVPKSLINTFIQLDTDVLKQLRSTLNKSGSCGLICYHDGSNKLYFANLGDSRAVLISDGKAAPLTIDHKLSNSYEIARIVSCGGTIFNNRLEGRIMVGRAFGDYELKTESRYLSPVPDIFDINIDINKDWGVILGCDGIYDVMSNDDIALLVNNRTKSTSQFIAKILVQTAIEKGSTDNCSVICLKVLNDNELFDMNATFAPLTTIASSGLKKDTNKPTKSVPSIISTFSTSTKPKETISMDDLDAFLNDDTNFR